MGFFDSDKVMRDVMDEIRTRAQRQLPSVTCPEHQMTFIVHWIVRGKNAEGSVQDPCCEKLEEELSRRLHELRFS